MTLTVNALGAKNCVCVCGGGSLAPGSRVHIYHLVGGFVRIYIVTRNHFVPPSLLTSGSPETCSSGLCLVWGESRGLLIAISGDREL